MKHLQRTTIRTATRAGAPIAILALASLSAFGLTQDTIDGTRAALEKWVETRVLISDEKRDWTEGKELLSARIDLVKREIETLRARTAEAEASIVETDRKRAELQSQIDAARTATRSLEESIARLEARLLALLPRLPMPLQETVKMISQRIPVDPAATKASLSERFLSVLFVLNAADKFNREVTAELEVRKVTDGTQKEVTTLYLGVGRAFYASKDGEIAGHGASSADGWEWTETRELARDVQAAIDVHSNAQPATFVRLPLRVD